MFTGTALSAAAMAILKTLLDSFLMAFGSAVTDWLAAVRGEKAQRDLGAAQTTSSINKESADAERRANDVANNRPDDVAVIDGMVRGDEF